MIAIEPDVHSVTLPGLASSQAPPSRPLVANGHATSAKKAAPSRTVSALPDNPWSLLCFFVPVTFSH